MIAIDVTTTRRSQMIDITASIREAVGKAGMADGLCLVFVPHTTAGITINENADPDVTADMQAVLSRLVPAGAGYAHSEGNADAHVKASLMGSSVIVPVENGDLALGTWQGIFFCEFDGPRRRKVWVGTVKK
jgi:secondary thiamine-phosphate synthase enzyme